MHQFRYKRANAAPDPISIHPLFNYQLVAFFRLKTFALVASMVCGGRPGIIK
jgi:hypothetical protein